MYVYGKEKTDLLFKENLLAKFSFFGLFPIGFFLFRQQKKKSN